MLYMSFVKNQKNINYLFIPARILYKKTTVLRSMLYNVNKPQTVQILAHSKLSFT